MNSVYFPTATENGLVDAVAVMDTVNLGAMVVSSTIRSQNDLDCTPVTTPPKAKPLTNLKSLILVSKLTTAKPTRK